MLLWVLEICVISKTPDRTSIGKNETDACIVNKDFIFNRKIIASGDSIKKFTNAGNFDLDTISMLKSNKLSIEGDPQIYSPSNVNIVNGYAVRIGNIFRVKNLADLLLKNMIKNVLTRKTSLKKKKKTFFGYNNTNEIFN